MRHLTACQGLLTASWGCDRLHSQHQGLSTWWCHCRLNYVSLDLDVNLDSTS